MIVRPHSIQGLPEPVYRVLFLAVVALILLRFLHLDADFPFRLTWAGVLYTDEGWYANAAVRQLVSGNWYLAGDFNPAVNMPFGQFSQWLFFNVAGAGIASARMLQALSFSIAILLSVYLVRREFGTAAGVAAGLLLASNFFIFAYSRLAIMEPLGIALILSALTMAAWAAERCSLAWLIGGSIIVGLAALTKGSMVFGIPLVAYLAWRKNENARQGIWFAAITFFVGLAMVGGYQVVAQNLFYEDFVYFNDLNVKTRLVSGIGDWAGNVVRQLYRMRVLGIELLIVAGVLCAGAAMTSRRFRINPLVHVFAGYGVGYFALLSVIGYGPPRYFLPLIVPLTGLCAIACVELVPWMRNTQRFRRLALAPPMIIGVLVVMGCAQTISYISTPQYTFRDMTSGVRAAISHEHPDISQAVVLGHLSDSIALEIGAQSMNLSLGSKPLDTRLRTMKPDYLVVHVGRRETLALIRAAGAGVVKLGAWDVYDNYYGEGADIRLYALDWDRQ